MQGGGYLRSCGIHQTLGGKPRTVQGGGVAVFCISPPCLVDGLGERTCGGGGIKIKISHVFLRIKSDITLL
jgi:hypothetical protein